MKPSTKEREAYQYFINKGYTPEVASAIVGNFMHESGLNTTIEGDKGYKGGSSFGLAQWRGERLSRLKSKYGENWTDFKNQLEFTDWELKNTHKKAGEMLKKAKTVDEAGAIFSDYYEIPAKKYHQDANRRSKVNKVYSSIGGMNIKTDFSNFEETKTSPTFVDVVHTQYGTDLPQVKEEKKDEVETAKEEIKQKTAEKTFLEDLKSNRLYEQPQEEEEQYIQPQEPKKSTLQSFNEIESFIDNPLFQEGGTWQSQQARVKAEKDAKLRELLKNKDVVKELEAQAQQRRGQLPTERAITQVDATNARNTNNPDKTSTTARNKTDKEIAEERQARIDAQTQANAQPFDWSNFRQSLAERSQATGDALRVSNEPNFFDDYLNPASMIGSMADNIGQAPLRAQQEDSFMPYVTAVGTPLAVGAIAGIGTNSTGQFVNNLANPLAGTGDLVNSFGNKFLPNAYNLNPYAKTIETFNNPNSFYRQIDDETFREGIESGLIRGKQNVDKTRGESIINLNKSFGDDAYYKKGSLYSPQRADYIYEVNKGEEFFIPKVNNRTRGYTTENTPIRVSKTPIPLEEASIYQKDWLQGYKELDNSISNPLIPLYRATQGQGNEEQAPQYQQGGEFSQAELAFLSEIAIKDNDGYRNPANKNKIVEINSPSITMKGIKQPLLAIPISEYKKQVGDARVINPNEEHYFHKAKKIIEIPLNR